ncbi:MAG: ABC transporter substrate-binding protein [Oscillospiraceae bacterium]
MKRRLLLLALSLLLLCGCAEAPPEPEDEFPLVSGQEETTPTVLPASFTLPLYAGQSLDPITCADGVQRTVSALLYEGLFELGPDFQAEPRLCDSYEYDPETFVYTFHIRQNVTFGDGSALTARDVTATLTRAQESERYQARFANVASLRYIGTDTVRITLKSADAHFPALLDIPIVKRGTENDMVPLGTGPYLYITEGSQDYLKANDAWWRGRIQPLTRIELSAVKDEDTAAYRFSSGEVQLLTSDLTDGFSLGATAGVTLTETDTAELLYLGFRADGPFADPALRAAVALGVDREGLVSGYLSGHGKAAQFPLSPASPLYPEDLSAAYDLNAFTKALTALGYGPEGEERERTVTLIVNEESAYKVSIARAVASALSYGRLTVEVKELTWERYTAALESGSFDLYLGEVRLLPNWDLSALLGTGGALNYGHYSSERMDQLLSDFQSADEADSAAAARRLCVYIGQEAPLVPICFKSHAVLTHTDVLSELTPTTANPFYGIERWKPQLAK